MKRSDRIEWPEDAPRLLTNPALDERRAFSRLLRRPFYVVADTHFFHRNIIEYARRPADHDSIMLERWRSTVGHGDVVLHLGDLFHWRGTGPQRFSAEIAPKLTGTKYLLLGNHDKEAIDYAGLGFEVIKPFAFEYLGYEISFSHWPMRPGEMPAGEKRLRVHGHIHNRGYRSPEKPSELWSPLGGVNVSVEVIDYTPRLVTEVLAPEVERRKGPVP
jgi:calcineurin-like phosphoesterase family protein